MDRLTIFAKYCPKNKNPADFANLITRGSYIFSNDEKDTKNASAFLIVLLDCIERWAKAYRKDIKTNQDSIFYKKYTELKMSGICFPSEAKHHRDKELARQQV
jgi:hypothetical protein